MGGVIYLEQKMGITADISAKKWKEICEDPVQRDILGRQESRACECNAICRRTLKRMEDASLLWRGTAATFVGENNVP
jgi:hypothetical protein